MSSRSPAARRGARQFDWPPGTALVILVVVLVAFVLLAMQLPEGTAPESPETGPAHAGAPSTGRLG